jgi:disulfide bond formation protein DsbB
MPAVSSRRFFTIMLVLSLGALAYALTSQYAFGYEPCMLCEFQRIPYWTIAGLSVIALVVPGVETRGVAWLVALIFACGAGIALYHVGVEQHWWASACSVQPGVSFNFDDFKAAPLKPILKSCDSIDWTLLGLSMATYNVAVSAVLALVSACSARVLTRG